VYQTAPVGKFQCLANLGADLGRLVPGQGAFLLKQLSQGRTINIPHGDEVVAFRLAHIKHRGDMRVKQLRRHLGFLHEAPEGLFISNQRRFEYFEGYQPFQSLILRPVDIGISSAAQLRVNYVAAKAL